MAWFTPFIIPAVMNAPQLLRSGNIGQYAMNTGMQGGINTAVGNIAPNFNMNPAPSYAPGFNPPMASNVSGLLTNSTGTLGNVASTAYTGPTSMMQANLGSNLGAPLNTASNLADKSMMETISRQGSPLPNNTFDLGMNANTSPLPESRVDLNVAANQNVGMDRPLVFDGVNTPGDMKFQGPDYTPKLGQSDLYTGGGEDTSPLYKKAYDKISQYVEDKPLEAALLGMTGAGAIYEGLKEPERQPQQPTLGPKLGGGQVNVGSPLQVRRSTPRRGR